MIESHESMRMARISAYPHMKKSNQTKFWKEISKHSRVKSFEIEGHEKKPMTTRELAESFGRALNGK